MLLSMSCRSTWCVAALVSLICYCASHVPIALGADQRLALMLGEPAEAAMAAAIDAQLSTEVEVRTDGRSDPVALPVPSPSLPSGLFDGTWTFTRSIASGCAAVGSTFSVRIQGGVVTGPGGKGRLSPTGEIFVPGNSNTFRGKLQGDTGSGVFSGSCTGTFTARRN
jgi:hypothetical protein